TGLTESFPGAEIDPVLGDYRQALATLTQAPRLLLFLGSTVGNMEDSEIAELARSIASSLEPGGLFLLGFDRKVHPAKPKQRIEAAYNDASGVTAAFNLNMLSRLNREYDARFDLSAFAHEAFYNDEDDRIEMHLRSRIQQAIPVPGLGLTVELSEGERIRTEISRKFAEGDLAERFSPLRMVASWTDSAELFGMLLFERVVT
ncbi:MAG: L-histidine N(alpha)-methyltransferase, partial [Cyanobacteria bacterium REEB65]|nr:L-histidine N(alpha)-methyltransferase [Cyanobacteria bacterium REEB65]